MIWIIGGTSDATYIVDALFEEGFKNILVSTTTSYGSDLAKTKNVKVVQQFLNQADMLSLIHQYKIDFVIDASHPFAQEVSENAIVVCKQIDCKYLRYERETPRFQNALYYHSYESMIEKLQIMKGNVLLTIGSKNVCLFKSFEEERIIARVLPVVQSIKQCEEAGLKAHQIIAMKGRMTLETNRALMQEYNIKHLVTKDSGEAGGLVEKIAAAHELDILVHILERPKICYPSIVNNFNSLINKVKLSINC